MPGAPYPFGTTITVQERVAAPVDRYGEVTYTWVSRTIDGCAVAPRSSSRGAGGELSDGGRQGVIVGLTVYAPPDSAIDAHARVEIDGELFEVDGEVGRWRSPLTGWAPGDEINLKRVEG